MLSPSLLEMWIETFVKHLIILNIFNRFLETVNLNSCSNSTEYSLRIFVRFSLFFNTTILYLTGTLTKEERILWTSTPNRQNPLSRSLRNAGILALGIRRCIATPGPMALDTHENQHPSLLRFSPPNQVRFAWSHLHFGSHPQRLRWRPNGPQGQRWIKDSESINWRIIRANLQIKKQHFTDF